MAESRTPGRIIGIVTLFITPLHPETSLPASSSRGLIVRRKTIVRSMGIGRKIENMTATQPGRPKRSRAVVSVTEVPSRCDRSPCLPRRSNHETAMMYGGISSGITKSTEKNLRKGKSVFPRSIPRGIPKATESTVTREERAMLCPIRVHWCADISRPL